MASSRWVQLSQAGLARLLFCFARSLVCGLALCVGLGWAMLDGPPASKDAPLRFDRDTVIIWTAEYQGTGYDFVIRIAQYEPKRLFEWESSANQGIVLLDYPALIYSRSFQTSKLFSAGSESKSKDETTIWLSKEAYLDLVRQGRARLKLDSIDSTMTLVRRETASVLINKDQVQIPAIVVNDSRGGEWLFHDDPQNPFFLRHSIRGFTQAVKSITTNRKNTLRWLKENKIRAFIE